jgi:hypothetical protein
MNIEQEIIDNAAKALANEIDFEILVGMLVELGWTKVVLSPMTWEDSYYIDMWTAQNIKGNFETMGLVWVFENIQDANWFKLRWLG